MCRDFIIMLAMLPALAVAQDAAPFLMVMGEEAPEEGSTEFRVTYLTGATPANLVLNASYAGPATAANALYDAGNGVWTAYTSKTIPIVGSYVAFKGNWLNAAGTYAYMFKSTFQSAAYTCKFQGTLLNTPTTFASCYYEIFRDCTAVTAIEDNPLPILTGAPASFMYYLTYFGMTRVTGSLPAGFMDTSGLTGAPAAYMLRETCAGMSGVTTLPTGFMDLSGLTGAPASDMFRYACDGMSGVTNAYNFQFGAGITFTSGNVHTLLYAFRGMSQWTGQVMWGTNVLVEAIPIPDTYIVVFRDCNLMPDYATIHTRWK